MSGPSAMLRVAASRPAPPGGRRVGGAEVERRLKIVEEQLARGAPRSEIIASTGLPARTVDGYLRRVRESWRDDAQEGRQDLRGRSLSRLMALRERLLRAQAWSPLVALERLIADVEGVRGPPMHSDPDPRLEAEAKAPAPTAGWVRERATLLVTACVTLARDSDDGAFRDRLRRTLVHGLEALEDARPPGARQPNDA